MPVIGLQNTSTQEWIANRKLEDLYVNVAWTDIRYIEISRRLYINNNPQYMLVIGSQNISTQEYIANRRLQYKIELEIRNDGW